jgi:hypothetical protein
MRHLGLLACGLFVIGCANSVPQDRSTGPDGKVRGARPIAFENGEGRAKGIVTYPGGDRVDWRSIELPSGKRGQLDLQLTWRAPRPGLQVAFDVFDQWNHPIVATNAAARRHGRSRTATIDDAVGKYFVRIYAPTRGDAGAYTLTASFKQLDAQGPVDPRTLPIPDPPRLAAVPPPAETCDSWDPSRDICKKSCPFDAPDGWIGCKDRDAAKKRDEDAKARAEARAACLKDAPKPFTTKVIHVEVQGDGVAVKLDAGTNDQGALSTGWTARVLVEGTDRPIANGTVQLRSVGTTQSRGVSRLTLDQLTRNQHVLLTPPAPACD